MCLGPLVLSLLSPTAVTESYASIGIRLLLIGVAVVASFAIKRRVDRYLAIDEPAPSFGAKGLLAGALLGLANLAALLLLLYLTCDVRLHFNEISGKQLLISTAVALASAPVEELMFRGIIQRRIQATLGNLWGVLIASAIFAAVHVLNPAGSAGLFVTLLPAMVFQFGLVYLLTRELSVCIAAHFIWNFSTLGLLASTLSGVPSPFHPVLTIVGPSLLTGGAFGIEGSLLLPISSALVLGCFLLLRGRLMHPAAVGLPG
jgi:hypothetical protein